MRDFKQPAGTPLRIEELLEVCVRMGGSDLHLSAGLAPKVRVDGDLEPVDAPVFPSRDLKSALRGIMNNRQREEFNEQWEVDFSINVTGAARFRVNAFRQRRGSAAVFRAIPSAVPSMQALGMGRVFGEISTRPAGLVVVTGPTGSGKSTTLAAMVDFVNEHRAGHILTIEDPIEFVHASKRCVVNQREVHRDTRSFKSALRAALREDPDVLLIGELRDLETIRLALTAAETGHLVFATLHTMSAGKTVDRIIDVFPAEEKTAVRALLSESLQAVVSQTLLKRIGGGRVAAHEIMLSTPAIRNLIREGKVAQMVSMIQTGRSVGMQTLDTALRTLLDAGVIDRETARGRARSPGEF